MNVICIIFTKSKKKLPLFSWAVMLWTWKSYSHVALQVELSYLDKSMYFQSNEGKVNYEYEDHFLKEHQIVKRYKVQIDDKAAKDLKIRRLKLAGANYGIWQNLGIVIVDLLKLIGIKTNNPWKKGINCSELIYSTVLKVLYPELDYNPETIKPHHIEEILINHGYKEC